MSTTSTGRQAEAVAANYLRQKGFEILVSNYRLPYCEIDIVALRDGIAYIVEVKYRQSGDCGGGFDYITPRKLQRMQRAAETWVVREHWLGEYQLAAVEVAGDGLEVTGFVQDIIF